MKNIFYIFTILFSVFIALFMGNSFMVPSALAKVTSIPSEINTSVQTGIMQMFVSASIIVQITMILLLVISFISWSIIFSKWKLFKNNIMYNKPFEDIFFKASSLDEIQTLSKSNNYSSLAIIFRSGYSELQKIIDSKKDIISKQNTNSTSLLPDIDNLQRALNKAINNEISFMEKQLSFLATAGTISPFIGLFGTVYGLLNSFQKIGAMGSANLAVVAPGISEALIATAIGLLVAIPASFFYNVFINKLKAAELQFNNFATDFLNTSKRNFFK